MGAKETTLSRASEMVLLPFFCVKTGLGFFWLPSSAGTTVFQEGKG